MATNNERMAEVDTELREATIELNLASHRYNAAILARIALRNLINKENQYE